MIAQCLILAGGLGTRLAPVTRSVPKTMIYVAGRPFASLQLEWLAGQGIRKVVYAIGHLGNQVTDFVGDGSRWGLEVDFVDEGSHLRGTGGAVRLAVDRGVTDDEFFVLYGDSYLQVSLPAVAAAYQRSGRPALMTVYHNDDVGAPSNVEFSDGAVRYYSKAEHTAGMRHIDYGLLVLSRRWVEDTIPPDTVCDLAPALSHLSRSSMLAAYEVEERFFEIGTPSGLAELEHHLRRGNSTSSSSVAPLPRF